MLLAASILVASLAAGAADAAHNAFMWGTYSGTSITKLAGTFIAPRKPPNGATNYVWPGLQPSGNAGVLQSVCDGRNGKAWWMANGWYGTPGRPWGSGFLVSPSDEINFSHVLNDNMGNWTSTLTRGSGDTMSRASSNFSLPGISMVWAVFDVELYGAVWDFGPVRYPRIEIVSTARHGGWCSPTPNGRNGAISLAIGSARATGVPTGISCVLTNVITWSPTALPLDIVAETPTAAYSLRKLVQRYAGKAVQIRRGSDNAVADIGFFANFTLNTTALLAFAGQGDAFVAVWYDQSGGSNHARQTVLSAQPQIVSNGTLFTINGRPAVFFNSSQADHMVMDRYVFSGSSAAYAYSVAQLMSPSSDALQGGQIFDFGNSTTYTFTAGMEVINTNSTVSTTVTDPVASTVVSRNATTITTVNTTTVTVEYQTTTVVRMLTQTLASSISASLAQDGAAASLALSVVQFDNVTSSATASAHIVAGANALRTPNLFVFSQDGAVLSISRNGTVASGSVPPTGLRPSDISPAEGKNFIGRGQIDACGSLNGLVSELIFFDDKPALLPVQDAAFSNNIRAFYNL